MNNHAALVCIIYTNLYINKAEIKGPKMKDCMVITEFVSLALT